MTAIYANIHAECFTTPRPWSQAEFDSLIADKTVFVSGDNIGFVMGRVIVDEAELLTIAVRPSARRTGQGRALLSAFIDTARARGAAMAFLEVAVDNTPAISLYKSAGFVESGRRPRYYKRPDGTAIDALVMQIHL